MVGRTQVPSCRGWRRALREGLTQNTFPASAERLTAALSNLCCFWIEDVFLSFLPPFHVFMPSWGEIKNISSFSSCKIVQRTWRSIQPIVHILFLNLVNHRHPFRLARHSVGIYSKTLLNVFPFSECVFNNCSAVLFGLAGGGVSVLLMALEWRPQGFVTLIQFYF